MLCFVLRSSIPLNLLCVWIMALMNIFFQVEQSTPLPYLSVFVVVVCLFVWFVGWFLFSFLFFFFLHENIFVLGSF